MLRVAYSEVAGGEHDAYLHWTGSLRVTAHGGTIDFSLLRRLSHLLLCSACLRLGVRTPIPQVISRRHAPRSLCAACQARDATPGRTSVVRLPLD